MSENKQRLPSFIGPSAEGRSSRFTADRSINLYLEMTELGAGKGAEPAFLNSTPGLKFLQTVGGGPIRAVYTLSNQNVMYVVTGSEVYQLSGNLSVPISIVGNLSTDHGPVSIADNGIQVMLVDGVDGYYINIGEPVLYPIVSVHFYPADRVSFQDGYFILNKKGTSYFFISDLYDVTFPESNLAAKAGNSDILVCAISNNRELYLLGANTTEIWYNQGQSGYTPFARQDGRFSQIGCAAVHSVCAVGESLMWLGSNAQGGGVVYSLQNAVPTRVSTHAVEFSLQKLGNISGATAYSYQQEGHTFYVLNVPGCPSTWVYDPMVKQWHERQSTVGGYTRRHIGQNHCVLNGQHIIGDYRNGNLYAYDLATHTDNGEMRIVMRQTPHVSQSLNRVFVNLFEVDAEFGVGKPNDGRPMSNVDPRLVLEISTDGGATWGIPMYAYLGKQGEYKGRARWQRLGSGRDIVFRVSCSDDVRVTLLSGWLDLEVGTA